MAWEKPEALLLIPRGTPSWLIREAYTLTESAGYVIYDVITYRRHSSKILSDYKLEEAVEAAKSLGENGKIIVYDDVKPTLFMRFAFKTSKPVIDRVLLILEIFSRHAGSREAKLQIELARIRHMLPIVREAIRRAKAGELPGFLGPGKYAIDKHYRYLVSRAAHVKREIEKIRLRRRRERERRKQSGLLHAAIIGYASAGKTSLFNTLTGSNRPVGEEYFTTLSPKRRAIELTGTRIALIDTVGFISNIPPELIEAFHATLEEAASADLELFIVDASEPEEVIRSKIREGINTLYRIGALGKPLLLVLNKIDLVDTPPDSDYFLDYAKSLYPSASAAVEVSAKNGSGVEGVVAWLEAQAKRMAKYTFYE